MRKLMIWVLIALMALSGFAFAESTAATVSVNGGDAVRTVSDIYLAIPDGARQMLVRVPVDGGDPICVDRGDRFEDLMPYGSGVAYLKSENNSSAIMACDSTGVSTVYAFGTSSASSLSYYSGRMLVLIDGLLHSIEPSTQLCLRLSGTAMLDYELGGSSAYFLSAGDRMEYTATLEGGETTSTQAGCVYSLDLNSGETTLLLKSGGRDLKISNYNLYFHNLADAYAVRTAESAELLGRVYSLDVQMRTLDGQCTEPDNGFWPLDRGLVVWYNGALNLETEAGTLALYSPENGATVVSDGESLYVWESGKQTLTRVETNGTGTPIYTGDLSKAVDLSLVVPSATPEPVPTATVASDVDTQGNSSWFQDFMDNSNAASGSSGNSSGNSFGSNSGIWPQATPIGMTPAPTPVPVSNNNSSSGSSSSSGSGSSSNSGSSGSTYSVSISYLKITGGSVNVRSGPGKNNSVKYTLSKGAVVKCTGTAAKDSGGNTWYQIKNDGSKGWVSAGYVKKTSAPDANYSGPEESMSGKTVIITGGSVNVRSKPNLNGSDLGVVTEGTKLSFKGKKSTDSRGVAWYKVSYNGKTGWVSSKYSKVSKSGSGSSGSSSASGSKVKATGDLTIRSKPNKNSEVLGYMKSGNEAKYEGSSKYDDRNPPVLWYKVTYKGITGWVSSKYAKLK